MTNLYKKIGKGSSEKNKKRVVSIIILVVSAVYFSMASVLNPWSVKLPSLDSAVWLSCTIELLEGKVMYVDMWDHKGPLLFFIHYVGLMLSKHSLTGIWILECIFLFITFIGLYQTASLIVDNEFVKIVSVLGCMHGFIKYYMDGDVVEQWALPFLSFSLYFFSKYLKTEQINQREIFFSGVFMAASFLLNGNLISVWIAYIPMLIGIMCKHKNWRHLYTSIILFLSGFMLIIVMTASVLVLQGALDEFIYIYFGFNHSYISDNNPINYYSAVMSLIYNDPWFGYVHVGLLISLLHKKKIDWRYSCFLYSFITLIVSNLSGRQYDHYGMQLIPCMIIPISSINIKIYSWCKDMKEYVVILLMLFALWGRFEMEAYTEKVLNTMSLEDRNDYAGGRIENYLLINKWLGYRWSEEQLEKWVINDR